MLLVECICIWWSWVQHFLTATHCCAVFTNAQLAIIPIVLATSSSVLFSRRLFTVVSERAVVLLGNCENLYQLLKLLLFIPQTSLFMIIKEEKRSDMVIVMVIESW